MNNRARESQRDTRTRRVSIVKGPEVDIRRLGIAETTGPGPAIVGGVKAASSTRLFIRCIIAGESKYSLVPDGADGPMPERLRNAADEVMCQDFE